MAYQLATKHIQNTGIALDDLEIKTKVHAIATEETVPAWTMKEWENNVFSTYLPCGILYEDKAALKRLRGTMMMGDDNDEYCSMAFNHEALAQNETIQPDDYAKTILSVLHEGADPPITKVHSARVLSEVPFAVKEEQKSQLKTFDPDR